MLGLILLVFAFVLSLIEAIQPWTRPFPRPHFGWLAVALVILMWLLQGQGIH
jgi:hypothetical protein